MGALRSHAALVLLLVLAAVAACLLVVIDRLRLTDVERAFVGRWEVVYESTPTKISVLEFHADRSGDVGAWSVHDGKLLVHRNPHPTRLDWFRYRVLGVRPDGYSLPVELLSERRIKLRGRERLTLTR